MRRYMVQTDLADQSKIGVRGDNFTLAFASGPFKRKKFFRRSSACRYAVEHVPSKVFTRGWVDL